ncbi:MAG: lipoyl synthase [bacterium]
MNKPFPSWLRKKLPNYQEQQKTISILNKYNLFTVCTSAKCPNMGECFSKSILTVLILGNICTRNCRFCAIETGILQKPDSTEPLKVAQLIKELNLKYAVITSVTRDDLIDGGAEHFALVIKEIRTLIPEVKIEVLTPDFEGKKESIKIVIKAKPDVFAHNIETVPSLYEKVRPKANYERSLKLLEMIKQENSFLYTKSGIMLGLGEKENEVIQIMEDLIKAGCDILTIGQYLSPSKNHLKVEEYIHPEKFEYYKKIAQEMGFFYVMSGPFVRSSFHANMIFEKN